MTSVRRARGPKRLRRRRTVTARGRRTINRLRVINRRTSRDSFGHPFPVQHVLHRASRTSRTRSSSSVVHVPSNRVVSVPFLPDRVIFRGFRFPFILSNAVPFVVTSRSVRRTRGISSIRSRSTLSAVGGTRFLPFHRANDDNIVTCLWAINNRKRASAACDRRKVSKQMKFVPNLPKKTIPKMFKSIKFSLLYF